MFALYAAHALLGLGGAGPTTLFDSWIYTAILVGGTAACLARAVVRPKQRTAWSLIGLGLLAFTAGDIYWIAALGEVEGSAFPSPADVAYLASYPLLLAGIALIVSARLRGRTPGLWLDAATVALAVAAIGSVFVIEAVADGLREIPGALAEGLVYPIADILMLAFLAALLVIAGRRPGATLTLLAASLAAMAVADVVYSYQVSTGGYVEASALDLLWPASALLVALAAWMPERKPLIARPASGWRLLLVPATVGVAVGGLYAYDSIAATDPVSEALILATTLAVLARLAFGFAENQRLISRIGHDSLTGLANRGQLELDLREALWQDGGARMLGLLDLDGFKRYNDSFGHPAGDALLQRLANRLRDQLKEMNGTAYRVGGDEFCVLVRGDADSGRERLIALNTAFSERGHGFEVSSSLGMVELPAEADSPEAAIQLADRRMRLRKAGLQVTAEKQAAAVLTRALLERAPELSRHTDDVADLASAVGLQIGLAADQLALLERAAALHDIGKVAIPDAILEKPGPLLESEQAFVRRHPVVGERIAASAPDLIAVARIIRSSHERFDGTGYPDGLEGDQAPIASRIIFVCDAYCAMTRPRSFSTATSPLEALLELRRCSGTQFDPVVVSAFAQTLAQREPEPSRAPSESEAPASSLAAWLVPQPPGLTG